MSLSPEVWKGHTWTKLGSYSCKPLHGVSTDWVKAVKVKGHTENICQLKAKGLSCKKLHAMRCLMWHPYILCEILNSYNSILSLSTPFNLRIRAKTIFGTSKRVSLLKLNKITPLTLTEINSNMMNCFLKPSNVKVR